MDVKRMFDTNAPFIEAIEEKLNAKPLKIDNEVKEFLNTKTDEEAIEYILTGTNFGEVICECIGKLDKIQYTWNTGLYGADILFTWDITENHFYVEFLRDSKHTDARYKELTWKEFLNTLRNER